ncbi:GHKL domain-containing protein [Listeria monocytogenes]|uniref:GHKL domain-containing protein n=1 Tax=Listeria innocua TaxID=1642 RepID=UPI0010B20C67|nr:GHKL domain-containing protein [Listeria innocua]EAC4616750.1 GHKL domain-containing protein [Listeria monocytogenes]EAD0622422.1 GHKL domain-containing protein [Listeria monocytogenes]ECZ8708261.1 sensor histidine kinase [Listeria monocytogenes]EHE1139537.1 sensor histidine kinase [Listeria monocytogenes]EHO7443045.1 GHKL domain-containing protein [Listeria monocytogenes]
MNIHLLICILILFNFIATPVIFKKELHFTTKDLLLYSITSCIIALLTTFLLDIPTEFVFLIIATFFGVYLFIKIRILLISTIIFLFFTTIIGFVWVGFSDTPVILFNYDPFLTPKGLFPIMSAVIECLILVIVLYSIKRISSKYALFDLIFSTNRKLPFITAYIIVSYYITYLAHFFAFSNRYQLLLINIILLTYLSSVCLFVYHILLENYQKKQLLLLNNRLQAEQTYIDNASSFKHDFKGLLLSLTTYIEQRKTTEALELLASITDYSNELLNDDSFGTVSHIQPIPIQSVLVEKIKKMNALKINFSLDISKGTYISSISSLDFIRCLDIIINNAIEASQSADNPQMKINIYKSDSAITLTVKNNYASSATINLAQINKRKFTSKTNHQGLGLYNLGKITHKYTNVSHSISIQNNLFVLTLVINFV